MEDKASVRMVIECFKDHWAFLDIVEDQSLTRELMFDKLFLHFEEGEDQDEEIEDLEERMVSIPILMLLGVLYCRSNRK